MYCGSESESECVRGRESESHISDSSAIQCCKCVCVYEYACVVCVCERLSKKHTQIESNLVQKHTQIQSNLVHSRDREQPSPLYLCVFFKHTQGSIPLRPVLHKKETNMAVLQTCVYVSVCVCWACVRESECDTHRERE